MPWNKQTPMDQKTQFLSEYLRDSLSFAELCRRYSISRKTGYKWISRYEAEGGSGLLDRSRRPHAHPRQTPDAIRSAIIRARQLHPVPAQLKLENGTRWHRLPPGGPYVTKAATTPYGR